MLIYSEKCLADRTLFDGKLRVARMANYVSFDLDAYLFRNMNMSGFTMLVEENC